MTKQRVGELRPSQIMFTYGIGAIADLPSLAAIVMGLEEWPPHGRHEIREERLLRAVQADLGNQVERLISLPIANELKPKDTNIGIPLAPFPTWLVCTRCDLLAPIDSGLFKLNIPFNRPTEACYTHPNCSRSSKYPPKAIPVRFLVACDRGHLDDFPWSYFVHRGVSDCPARLRLIEPSVSGSLTETMVECDICRENRILADALGMSGRENMPGCRGRHPHLRRFDEGCDRQMKTLLLGASNSWFSLSLSALSIPTDAAGLAKVVEENWTVLDKAENLGTLAGIISAMQAIGQLQDLIDYEATAIWEAIQQKRDQGDNPTDNPKDLKTPEWEIFATTTTFTGPDPDWQLRPIPPPADFTDIFEQVILAERLREVRGLIGFTRIQSPGDFTDSGEVPPEFRAPLGRENLTWIPAMEVRGEGIFLQFKESTLQAWEQREVIKKRHIQVKEAHKNWLNQRNPDLVDQIPCPDMRYVLLHSFAHALMRQFALECGYNAASMQERIYAQGATPERAAQGGVLIYTAAPDSEGTLGGLVSLGAERLNYHIHQALAALHICASDPLCADHSPADDRVSLHWAACHACLFSPETSCERGNKFLDRALLIPTLSHEDACLFKAAI